MKSRDFRIGRLTGAAALAVLTPCVAFAQQGTPSPTPRATPPIITLPGANNFDLRPSGAQPARPTAQPTPPPTAVRPTPTPSSSPAAARATPTPRPTATAAARPATQPTATPTPLASPSAKPVSPEEDGTIIVTGTRPIIYATPTPAPAPVEPESGTPWLWVIAGAAIASVLVLLGWLLGRRRRPVPVSEPVAVAPPRPAPPPPAAAPSPPPPPAPKPVPQSQRPVESIMVEMRPISLEIAQNGAILDFELGIVNATNAPIDGIRLAYGMIAASQTQDETIAGFHATRLPPAVDPFQLGPRAGVRVPGRVFLSADQINMIEVGGRPMFVPILLIDLRWSASLSLKHQGSDFMVGMGGQDGKLGPIWLDRGAQKHERLNANRYFRKPASVAAA